MEKPSATNQELGVGQYVVLVRSSTLSLQGMVARPPQEYGFPAYLDRSVNDLATTVLCLFAGIDGV